MICSTVQKFKKYELDYTNFFFLLGAQEVEQLSTSQWLSVIWFPAPVEVCQSVLGQDIEPQIYTV